MLKSAYDACIKKMLLNNIRIGRFGGAKMCPQMLYEAGSVGQSQSYR